MFKMTIMFVFAAPPSYSVTLFQRYPWIKNQYYDFGPNECSDGSKRCHNRFVVFDFVFKSGFRFFIRPKLWKLETKD